MKARSKNLLILSILFLLSAIGLFIRLYKLDIWTYSPDDVLHLSYGRNTNLADFFHDVVATNSHPAGFFAIIYYMEKLSLNEMFLRSIAYVPGIILIPIFYSLGYNFKGRIAGIFMAYIAAFNYELVEVSETIRQYSLMLCFESGALIMLFKFSKTNKASYLYYYTLLSALALNMQYSVMLFVFTCGFVWFCKLLKQRNFKLLVIWSLLHIALVLMVCGLIYLKYESHTLAPDVNAAAAIWLDYGFPAINDYELWLVDLFHVLIAVPTSFMIFPTAIIIFGPLLVFGWGAVFKENDYGLKYFILVAVITNMVLAALKIYPLAGGRHCLYLLPFTALIFAAGAEWIYNAISAALKSKDAVNKRVALPALVLLLLGVGLTLGNIFSNDIYRFSPNNFVLTRDDYRDTMEFFEKHTKPGDIIISERSFADYLYYAKGSRQSDDMGNHIRRLNYEGRKIYYPDNLAVLIKYDYMHEMQAMLFKMENIEPGIKQQPFWFFTIGWNSVIHKMLIAQAPEKNQAVTTQSSAWQKITHDFDTSANVTDRFTSKTYATGIAYKTNWNFVEKELLSPNMIKTFAQEKL